MKTSISEIDGSDASPSMTFASGTPSSTLFEKMPPIANTDCDSAVQPEAFGARRSGQEANTSSAAAEVRDEQAGIDRRQAGEVAHQPEQERRDRHGEHEARQRIGGGARPAEPARQRVTQQHEQEERRGKRDQVPKGRHLRAPGSANDTPANGAL